MLLHGAKQSQRAQQGRRRGGVGAAGMVLRGTGPRPEIQIFFSKNT